MGTHTLSSSFRKQQATAFQASSRIQPPCLTHRANLTRVSTFSPKCCQGGRKTSSVVSSRLSAPETGRSSRTLLKTLLCRANRSLMSGPAITTCQQHRSGSTIRVVYLRRDKEYKVPYTCHFLVITCGLLRVPWRNLHFMNNSETTHLKLCGTACLAILS